MKYPRTPDDRENIRAKRYSKHYIDIRGDIWIRINKGYVQRVRDGNIGKWLDGKGLEELK